MNGRAFFAEARSGFYAALQESVLRANANGVPNNADKHSNASVDIATRLWEMVGVTPMRAPLAGQRAGNKFEEACKNFLEETFLRLAHIRPGKWDVSKGVGGRSAIAQFDQYEHLAELEQASKANPELAAALGSDYLIKPDVVVVRSPEDDNVINSETLLVNEQQARHTPLRQLNNQRPILHACISCKWTLRSDRAQNARSEALNLVRNRKGRLPHIVVVTAEPTPHRIASIALGTGDIDCVYHFALPELEQTVQKLRLEDAEGMLKTMVGGKRLRDIADLPLDLAI